MLEKGTKVTVVVEVAGLVDATVVVPPRKGGWVQLVRDTDDGPFVFEIHERKIKIKEPPKEAPKSK